MKTLRPFLALLKHGETSWISFRHRHFVQAKRLTDADAIFTHLTLREKRKLFDSAKNVGGVIVEIGSYLGASSCFLAAGAQVSGNSGKVYCVDTWNNDAMTEGNRDTFAAFRENTKPYLDVIIPMQGLSADVGRSFELPIDLLFFDGDHSYEGVKNDWDAWLPSMQEGGMVLFHDVGWAEGVQRLVREEVEPCALSSGRLPNLYWAVIGKASGNG